MTFTRRRAALGLAAGVAALPFLSISASAEPVVNVTLIDRMGSSNSAEAPKLGMGMGGDMATAKMGINANPKSVRRGPITFKVTNLASRIIHEVIVARLSDGAEKLPYDETTQLVDETALQTFGSVKEIEPNKSAALTLDLQPGTYLLYCNLPGHYMAGMWTLIDVTE